jgi:hypothetical protein
MRKLYILVIVSLFAGYAYSQDPQCLENDIIHRYMNEFSYDTIPDYDVSYVMDYFNEGKTAGYRMDAPKPVSLSWTLNPGAVAQRVEVSEKSDYSDAWVYNARNDTAGYDVYNLIPGKKYYYRVISTDSGSNESVVKEGEFNTSGELRMILAEGAWNIRDMGGWTSTLTGQPVAYGKIYRGGQLKAKGKDSILLSNEGIEFMRMIGIRAELDLRSSDQVPSSVSALARKDGNNQYDVDFNIIPEAVNARMYHFQNNDANIRELQWIINELKQNKPVFFHCQNGADRTGTLGFLIGALLGVSEGNLAKDYELTTFCEEAAAAYDPTEVGFARLRNYTGKKGSPLGSSEDNKEYMFAELANTMKSVSPANGTYHEKIYNFFRTGISGTKISASDLSWFIKEMTGYSVLAGMTTGVDTLRLAVGATHQFNVSPLPADAPHAAVTYKTTSSKVATVSANGKVTATGPGKAYIIVTMGGDGNREGIEKLIPVIVPITADNVPGYSVLDDAVSSYLTDTHYSADDYTTSTIANYLSGTARKDRSQPVTFKWMVYPGATGQHLLLSSTPGFESYDEIVKEDADSTHTVSGLLPDQLYYYKIVATFNGRTDTLVSSAFKTTGVVNMVYLKKSYNIRDLGGWTGMNGHKVKYGVLYRGSRLKDGTKVISNEDVKDLLRLGLTAELDLRSDEETTSSTSALNRDYDYERIADAAQALGANVTSSDAYIKALSAVIGWLKDDNKVYMGSSMGAERMGTLVFLINGLLGVDEEDLCKDYELSSFSGDKNAGVYKRSEGDFPAMVAAIKGLNGNTLQEKIYRYFSEGIYGLTGSASISKADLNWFISYMLGCPASEVESSPMTRLESVKAPVITGKIYNLLGQEVENPGPGIYIMNGKKFIIR